MPVMAVTSVTVARADRLFNKSDTGDHSCKWSTNGRSYVNTSVMDQLATSADIKLQPATSADITLCYCGVLMMQGTPGLCKTSSLPRRRTPTDRTAEIRIWSCHASPQNHSEVSRLVTIRHRGTFMCYMIWRKVYVPKAKQGFLQLFFSILPCLSLRVMILHLILPIYACLCPF